MIAQLSTVVLRYYNHGGLVEDLRDYNHHGLVLRDNNHRGLVEVLHDYNLHLAAYQHEVH
ncbi:hypothetical protein SADUNF_Sadunf02G0014500 [Salix dunnii]|uniref:Uncharacterized protein n=1 Tax=Salix dunnii TaxID=1413687 RepID=A0A835N5R4_9ROSI|nr:hypothetical protein SADUNF_Sadunf02G0014500 [Salix dunnii]